MSDPTIRAAAEAPSRSVDAALAAPDAASGSPSSRPAGSTATPPSAGRIGKRLRERIRTRPLAVAGVAIVLVEVGLAVLGVRLVALSAFAALAPGLGLTPLLPRRMRTSGLATLSATPVLGFAASSVGLISLARLGVRLDPWAIRAMLLVLALAGLALGREPDLPRGVGRWEAGGLFGALVGACLLDGRVIGGTPLPGNDWAKYVLYADEIRRHGFLLISNPYWMLGTPFRDDPGVPAIYGAVLAMGRAPAAAVAHGIWAFALMTVLSAFAFARALWGPVAGVLAAALWAALPMSQDILGWHGLANEAALALMPLAFLGATQLASGKLSWREAAGLALVLVATLAAHRLSGTLAVGTVAVVVVAAMAVRRRRAVAAGVARSVSMAAVLGGLVAADLATRASSFGGTQASSAYRSTRVQWGPVANDLSWPFVVVGAVAVVLAAVRVGRDLTVRLPLACLGLTALLAYAWVVHLPLSYLRMAYYLPLALVPLAALALSRLAVRRWAPAAWLVLVLAIGITAWLQAGNVRAFYAFTDRASLRGLDALSARLRPGEVVVTDRCWSFLATWLLHTRTLAALEPEDILPKAELPFARTAQAVLSNTPAGVAAVKRLGIRFAVVDPTCTDQEGRALPVPRAGRPVYISERLAIIALSRGAPPRR